MNSQPPTNSTGPITKPAVTQSSNVSSEQGVLYKILELFKLIKSMLVFKIKKYLCIYSSDYIYRLDNF